MVNFDAVFHEVFYPSKEDLMTEHRVIVTTLVTAGRLVMRTYSAFVVQKLSTRLGRFSVDAFAPSTAYLEVVRENWIGTASCPFQFLLSE